MILNGFFEGLNNELTIRDNNKIMENTAGSEKVSINQISHFTELSEKYWEIYNAGGKINSNDTSLKNDRLLKNYKIVIDGDYIKIVDIYHNYQYGFFSLTNRKLKKDTNTTYIIWNIPQKLSCIFSTEICEQICYADKYPNNLKKNIIGRSKNMILSTYVNFGDIFQEVIDIVNKIYSTDIFIRIHESGDFYNKEYFNKIAKVCNNNPHNNIALGYTKNITLLHEIGNLPKKGNLVMRYSIMEDTPEKYQEMALINELNTFICTDTQTDKIPVCGGKCSQCLLCYNGENRNIIVRSH